MAVALLSRAFWRPQPLRLPSGRNLTQIASSNSQPLQPVRFRLHNNHNRPPQPQSQPRPPRRALTTKAEAPSQIRQKRLPEPHVTKTEALPQAEAHKSLPSPGPAKDDPIPIASNVTPLPLWQRLGPLTWFADSYGRAQRRRPYLTQFLSALVIALCADMSVQRINRGEPYDPKRTVRSLIIGGVFAIPGYRWYIFLSHHFNYASRALSLIVKVAINQFVFTPVFNTYFFGMQALLAGETLEASWARVQMTVPISMANSLKVWPALTAFSFTFVPLEYRSLFAGVFTVGWQTYLMLLNRRAEEEKNQHNVEATDVLPVTTVAADATNTPSIAATSLSKP